MAKTELDKKALRIASLLTADDIQVKRVAASQTDLVPFIKVTNKIYIRVYPDGCQVVKVKRTTEGGKNYTFWQRTTSDDRLIEDLKEALKKNVSASRREP